MWRRQTVFMSTLLPVPMPHWAAGRLEYLWCTGCNWRFPIHTDSPDRETERLAKAAYEAHDCAHVTLPK